MNNTLKKLFCLTFSLIMVLSLFSACGEKKKLITIYSTSEDYRIEQAQKMMNEKFPEYDIRIEYMSTGNLSAKLKSEGKNTDCDIIMELENVYLQSLSDNLATLDNVDFSVYLDDLVPENRKYVPLIKTTGAVVLNKKIFSEKDLVKPTSFDDLLLPAYKGLISMPSPKASSTGYMFYLALCNAWGEEKALQYFDGLKENISSAGFTSSGSGPLQQLKLDEAAIAFTITAQAVTEMSKGADFEILFFEEGAPYNVYSSALIEGKQNDPDIMKVFEYLVEEVCPKDKEMFSPEKIYKDKDYTLESYPKIDKTANMTGINDIATKEALLDKWKY